MTDAFVVFATQGLALPALMMIIGCVQVTTGLRRKDPPLHELNAMPPWASWLAKRRWEVPGGLFAVGVGLMIGGLRIADLLG